MQQPALYADERFKNGKLRKQNASDLIDALDEAFARFSLDEIATALDANDIVWAPVQTPAEAIRDPQLMAAGGVVDVPLPGGGSFKGPATPVRFPGADDGPKGPTPRQGEHTRSVLAQLGYSETQIDAMIAAGAAKQA